MSKVIDRLIVMVHPSIYAASRHVPEFAASRGDYIEYEEMVEERWVEGMRRTTDRDALVACSPATEDLADTISSIMGDRGIILRENIIAHRDLWNSLLTTDAKIGLGRDLMAMFWRNGFRWNSGPLVQPIIARGWAERIKLELGERGMSYDPATVRAEGWGESFEGCVANYTRYLGRCLGLTNPIEIEFEMTVPDARFLLGADLLERIALSHDVRLFLWKLQDGRLAGWFHRALVSIGDVRLFSRIPVGKMRVEVVGKRELYWPIRDSHVGWEDDKLVVPVEDDHFILARGTGEEDFREALTGAELKEGEDGC
jgi:hypothetical protein